MQGDQRLNPCPAQGPGSEVWGTPDLQHLSCAVAAPATLIAALIVALDMPGIWQAVCSPASDCLTMYTLRCASRVTRSPGALAYPQILSDVVHVHGPFEGDADHEWV